MPLSSWYIGVMYIPYIYVNMFRSADPGTIQMINLLMMKFLNKLVGHVGKWRVALILSTWFAQRLAKSSRLVKIIGDWLHKSLVMQSQLIGQSLECTAFCIELPTLT